jgi:hypothetical protein
MDVRPGRWAMATAVAVVSLSLVAQESVNKDLDSCIRTEQIQSTAKGAAVGALAGLLKGVVSKDDNKGKNIMIGAAIGGVAGFVAAYYKAVGTCYRKNPSWVPETSMVRNGSYDQAKSSLGYKSEMGPVAKTFGVSAPATVRRGSDLPLVADFAAMMPDGSEADVVVERKFSVIQDGKETPIDFPGPGAKEQKKMESGRFTDPQKLPIPPDMPVGAILRYQFGIGIAGKPLSTAVAQTQVI